MSAVAFDPDIDFDRHFADAVGRRVRRFFRPGDRVLELGCATGLMTRLFAERAVAVTALDRDPAFLARAHERGLAGTAFVLGDALAFSAPAPFEHVVAAHLINELPDPVALLARFRDLVAPGGLIHVSVCNDRSLHRLVAAELDLADDHPMIDGDKLEALGREAGLDCLHREPVLLKPLANGRLAELPTELIEGFDRVAWRFPEHGGVNYAIFAIEAP